MDKTTTFVFLVILNLQLNNCEDDSKQEIIAKIIQQIKYISDKAISNTLTDDPTSILENIKPLIVKSAAQYPNSKAYVDIIMKGFQLMMLNNNHLNLLRNNMKQMYKKLSTNVDDNSNELNSLKKKNIEIEDIIDKLKDFANKHEITLKDALEIIKFQIKTDIKNRIYSGFYSLNTTRNNVEYQNITNLPWNYKSNNETYEATASNQIMEFRRALTFSTIDDISPTSNINAVTASLENQLCFISSCLCKENTSIPINNKCIDFCLKICSQKFNLQQWICKSFNGSDSVHLNFTCDGAFDCRDGSDENECNYNSDKNLQFKSNVIFKDHLQPLANPDKEKEFTQFRSKLRALYNRVKYIVKNIQYKSSNGDIQIIILRNNVLQEILEMYNTFSKKLPNYNKINDIYIFLSNIKLEIVRALKLSVTGNIRSTPEGQCLCRDNTCAVPKCSNDCQNICSSFSLFDRYYCKGSDLKQQFISMNNLCDGKYDCSKLDDEIYCQKEPCRGHHLIMLRRKLLEWDQKTTEESKGRHQKVLKSWITKITDKLKYEETNLIEKHKSFSTIIKETLMECVLEYKNYEEIAKYNDPNIDKYKEVAQIIIDSKRLCGI